MITGKTCTNCQVFKGLSEFYKEGKCADGHKGKCKSCMKTMKHSYYLRNKEKYKRAFDEFLKRNPGYYKEYYIKTKNHN